MIRGRTKGLQPAQLAVLSIDPDASPARLLVADATPTPRLSFSFKAKRKVHALCFVFLSSSPLFVEACILHLKLCLRDSGLRFYEKNKNQFSLFQQAQLLKMCHYQPWEDDSLSTEDHARSTGNGTHPVVTGWHSWETRIAMLGARIARIEARLDGLETRMFYQQKALQVISVLFLITLAYAMWK